MTHNSLPTGKVTRYSSQDANCCQPPPVQADLAALAALAASHEDGAASAVEVALTDV